jgi:nucleotide-binding universal stress UspA family protein
VSEQTAGVLDPLSVHWRLERCTGDPVAGLEAAAAGLEAELIVIGGRGCTAAHRLLVESLSSRLVHHADRPVVVVR